MCSLVSLIYGIYFSPAMNPINHLTLQEQPFPHFRNRYSPLSCIPISSLWTTGQKLKEIRGRYLFRLAKLEGWDRCYAGRTEEPVPRFPLQEQLHPNTEKAEGLLLVQRAS